VKQGGRIVELHKGTPHALVLCGLLPSPATHNLTSVSFDVTSRKLNDLCEQSHSTPAGRYISYLKLSHLFNDQDGLLDYNTYFESDGVHLNPTGAYRLAKYLVGYAIDFAESCKDDIDISYLEMEEQRRKIKTMRDDAKITAENNVSLLNSLAHVARVKDKERNLKTKLAAKKELHFNEK
jgi:hypothetical protein